MTGLSLLLRQASNGDVGELQSVAQDKYMACVYCACDIIYARSCFVFQQSNTCMSACMCSCTSGFVMCLYALCIVHHRKHETPQS